MTSADAPYSKIIIRNMRVEMLIGVHEHEKRARQTVIVNAEIYTDPPKQTDEIRDVLNYEIVASGIDELACGGHIHLVETLAERIAELCLKQKQAHAVMVRVEKPDIFESMDAVGVEIFRTK
jgi:dihydroneopterin aldolase